jgi:hypothetical protein
MPEAPHAVKLCEVMSVFIFNLLGKLFMLAPAPFCYDFINILIRCISFHLMGCNDFCLSLSLFTKPKDCITLEQRPLWKSQHHFQTILAGCCYTYFVTWNSYPVLNQIKMPWNYISDSGACALGGFGDEELLILTWNEPTSVEVFITYRCSYKVCINFSRVNIYHPWRELEAHELCVVSILFTYWHRRPIISVFYLP